MSSSTASFTLSYESVRSSIVRISLRVVYDVPVSVHKQLQYYSDNLHTTYMQ